MFHDKAKDFLEPCKVTVLLKYPDVATPDCNIEGVITRYRKKSTVTQSITSNRGKVTMNELSTTSTVSALNDTGRKTKVIAIAANKGGVSKTRHAILLANALGSAGYKVCVFDLDPNNSSTAFYLAEENRELQKAKNMAKLISDPENNVSDFSISTEHKNVFIVPSSLYLADYRTVEERRLKKIISHDNTFDFIIIDCQPDYNNLTINAMVCANWIITPVLKDLDSFDAALFLKEKLISDYPEKYDSWFLNINGYNKSFENSQNGKQKEYIDLYLSEFENHTTPKECWFPWTNCMNDIKDRHMNLAKTKGHPNSVVNEKLYEAVVNLAECFIDEEKLNTAEVF